MNKNKVLLLLSIILMLVLVGCGNNSDKKAYKLKDHITLGEYKGVEVDAVDDTVSDRDLNAYIKSELLSDLVEEKEVTDRKTIQDGDLVNIDFEGLLDGEAFQGGTAEGFELEIGSGQFIEGFEEKLIGVNVGDTANLDLKFPEGYQSADLAGQDVVFVVKVNSIISEKIYPELTDEVVKENTEFETVDTYMADTRTKLEEARKEQVKNIKINEAFQIIKENSEIISYPETEIERFLADMRKYYEEYAKSYELEFEEFLETYMQTTLEDFEATGREMAKEAVQQQLIIESIVEKEKIKLSKNEYEEGLDKLLVELEFETKEELFEQVTEEQIRENLLWQKALDFIADNVKEI